MRNLLLLGLGATLAGCVYDPHYPYPAPSYGYPPPAYAYVPAPAYVEPPVVLWGWGGGHWGHGGWGHNAWRHGGGWHR